MLAWLMSAPCRSSAATSSRSPAEQAAINTAPWANRTLARRVPEPPKLSRASVPVWSVSEPSHRCSWSCRRCLAASDREWSVAAIFPGLSRTDSAHGTSRSGVDGLDWVPPRAVPPGGHTVETSSRELQGELLTEWQSHATFMCCSETSNTAEEWLYSAI